MMDRANRSAIELFANAPSAPPPPRRPSTNDPVGRIRMALDRNAAHGDMGAIRELRDLDAMRVQ